MTSFTNDREHYQAHAKIETINQYPNNAFINSQCGVNCASLITVGQITYVCISKIRTKLYPKDV